MQTRPQSFASVFFYCAIISRFAQDRGHRNGRRVDDASVRLPSNQYGRRVAQLRVRSLRRGGVRRKCARGGSRLGWHCLLPSGVHHNARRGRGADAHRVDNPHGRRVEWRCVRSLRRERGCGLRVFDNRSFCVLLYGMVENLLRAHCKHLPRQNQ